MRIDNTRQLQSLEGADYERALVTLHHCDDRTLARAGISRVELDSLMSDAGTLPGELRVVGEPAPPPRARWSPRDFLERFTLAERIAIRAAAREDPLIEDWLDILRTSRVVYADDLEITGGIAALVDADLVSQARADAILSPDPEEGPL
ncbi:MAG TPA: hypothetical protein VFS30_08320 [Dehalococcoidia bacterium]|jgi:hypothetical protein|nr:hypothetical protein [Dehalococcoidia bacterium]